jgi:hypothetical protein
MKQQTAVRYAQELINIILYYLDDDELERINDVFEYANEMFEKHIINAHLDGQSLVSCKDEYAEQYYNDTFKSE